MFYTIYKITNTADNKIYIGKHQTQDLNDGYMGSGKHLKRAQTKHGIENFRKEILFQFDNEDEMNAKEAELVTEEFCLREDTYNLCPGGKGGWGYLNASGLNRTEWHKLNSKQHMTKISINANKRIRYLRENDSAWKEKNSKSLASALNKRIGENGPTFLGKNHSDEAKRRIGEANSKLVGQRNSQFGTMWITNGQENKKIKKGIDIIPEGWYKGRV